MWVETPKDQNILERSISWITGQKEKIAKEDIFKAIENINTTTIWSSWIYNQRIDGLYDFQSGLELEKDASGKIIAFTVYYSNSDLKDQSKNTQEYIKYENWTFSQKRKDRAIFQEINIPTAKEFILWIKRAIETRKSKGKFVASWAIAEDPDFSFV